MQFWTFGRLLDHSSSDLLDLLLDARVRVGMTSPLTSPERRTSRPNGTPPTDRSPDGPPVRVRRALPIAPCEQCSCRMQRMLWTRRGTKARHERRQASVTDGLREIRSHGRMSSTHTPFDLPGPTRRPAGRAMHTLPAEDGSPCKSTRFAGEPVVSQASAHHASRDRWTSLSTFTTSV